jgi:D-alanyl-D-alanine dipeptidase
MRSLFVLLWLSASILAKVPASSTQLLVVTTSSWSASSGRLQRYEKRSGKWQKIGSVIAVKVGKNGLAWGRGLHHIPKGATRIKREGDGRAPAGIFRLSYAFGEKPLRLRYPYQQMSRAHHCVDDSHSRYYNRVINSRKVTKDYKSFEHMKFPSGLYSYGLFVDHNPERIPMAGSCIFMHIKKPSGKPTVGCTAMSKSEIISVLKWLDPQKKPLLVQAPKNMMERLWR